MEMIGGEINTPGGEHIITYILEYKSPQICLRGNVGENQRGAPTCRHNLCSYSGYHTIIWICPSVCLFVRLL